MRSGDGSAAFGTAGVGDLGVAAEVTSGAAESFGDARFAAAALPGE